MSAVRFGIAFLAGCLAAGVSSPSGAEPLERQNYIPAGGYLFDLDEQLGDAWSFECPRGGRVIAVVDTGNDNNDLTSNLDPQLTIFDGEGNELVTGDDEVECSFQPSCSPAGCPAVNIPCGDKGPHLAVIVSRNTECIPGGQYRLLLEVLDRNGFSVEGKKVRLGGGAKRKLPKWLDPDGTYAAGPLLDDEKVPLNEGPLYPDAGAAAAAAAASPAGRPETNAK